MDLELKWYHPPFPFRAKHFLIFILFTVIAAVTVRETETERERIIGIDCVRLCLIRFRLIDKCRTAAVAVAAISTTTSHWSLIALRISHVITNNQRAFDRDKRVDFSPIAYRGLIEFCILNTRAWAMN